MTLGDGATGGTVKSPPPAVGATLIAAAVVVLIIGMAWLSRTEKPTDRLAVPMVDGVTLPTDRDGHAVDVPPSQPAVAVSFGANGEILRPDPVRARVVDESGAEIIITLPPNTTVDMVTGEIVPRPPGSTTGPGSTPPTTRGSTTTTGGPSTTPPPTTTTEPPTTTTEPPTTTTEPPTTTTEPPTTTTEPPPPPDPLADLGLLGALIPGS